MRRASFLRSTPSSFIPAGSRRIGAAQSIAAGPLRGIASSTSALSLSKRSSLPLARQSARWMATQGDASSADSSQKQQHDNDQQQTKNEQQKEKQDDERKEDEEKKEDWEKSRGGGGGGYKQEVNTFQKLLAVGIPVTALVLGVKVLLDMQATGAEDDTLQVDMNVIMGHVFQNTVYNVLDSKRLVGLLGDPLLVEPSKAKFSFTKDSAWVCYPLYAPQGHVCTVTVDLLRIDPKGKDVKTKKPHMWYVAQVEVDLNNGKKMLMSTRMSDGLRQPFNVLTLFAKLYHDLKKQEQEFLQQQAATLNPAPQ